MVRFLAILENPVGSGLISAPHPSGFCLRFRLRFPVRHAVQQKMLFLFWGCTRFRGFRPLGFCSIRLCEVSFLIRLSAFAFPLSLITLYHVFVEKSSEFSIFSKVFFCRRESFYMTVKSFSATDNTQLTEHFNAREFRCKCGKSHDFLISDELVSKLEQLYAALDCGKIIVNSGYRCPEHDKAVGRYEYRAAHQRHSGRRGVLR